MIYVFGGSDGTKSFNDLQIFDLGMSETEPGRSPNISVIPTNSNLRRKWFLMLGSDIDIWRVCGCLNRLDALVHRLRQRYSA
jgi:hypothetical protein